MHFLGHWARKLSWKGTAEEFGTSWDRAIHPRTAMGGAYAPGDEGARGHTGLRELYGSWKIICVRKSPWRRISPPVGFQQVGQDAPKASICGPRFIPPDTMFRHARCRATVRVLVPIFSNHLVFPPGLD